MKDLLIYIKEELESDNILWLLDKWFERDEKSKQEFINIVFQCQKDHTTNNVEKYLNQTQSLKSNLKQFINFVLNDVTLSTNNQNINYIYQLQSLIKNLIANKNIDNKYIKK